MNRRRVCTVLLALLAQELVAAQIADPLVGVWVLDVSASTSTGGMPSASTLTITPSGSETLRFEIRDTFDGRPQQPWGFVAGRSGSETPVTPATFIDSVATTRRQRRSSALILKKGGVAVSEMSTEVSEDGLTLVVTSKATAPNGDTVSGTSVYRRQPS
ncbi:hypothetical protein LuPra_05129 [Luteitalea pratensis]|uniref:Lipocalin-like domain-containing protein n=1 Tax=Luteitalea pratensis TaxID=1855912 RepID=A0A143PTF1_LUTPR|nr:hypothetical protein LuPra_05129 [Luteitalea pratensis]